MEDLIANVLKNYNAICRDNIEDVISMLALRGITIDRCSHKYQLEFYDSIVGKATQFQSDAFRRSPAKIPNFEEFHKLAYSYLSNFTIDYQDAARIKRSADAITQVILCLT